MRFTLIFIISLSTFSCWSQSKKELRLELQKANEKTDSLNKVLEAAKNSFQKQTDSLQLVIDDTQKRLNAQYQFTKTQEESINKCTSRNASLRSENEQLRESLRQTQSKSTTKTKKEATNPFSSGQGGRGNDSGTAYGIGNDNGEGGKGTGPGNHRNRLTEANVSSINSTEKGIITLMLTIDSEGNVIHTEVYKEQTTISNQAIIEQVKTCVKRDVKYQSAEHSNQQKVKYRVNIN
jgi:regulator of replication initiation timing